MKATVLCARRDSVYRSFPDLDIFDADRDAWTFDGSTPVIAHPPCRLFGKLHKHAKADDPIRERALGVFCAHAVLSNGGVLEHPSYSKLWKLANLPLPGKPDSRGFTLDIDQYWFGHPCIKRTWLFVSGLTPCELPSVPFQLGQPVMTVEMQSRSAREKTPLDLAVWCHAVAMLVFSKRERSVA